MAEWEDYVIDGTNILKNKYNISSLEELTKLETSLVVSKLSYLYIHGMKGNFDENHLCEIHKFLFDDLYEFAGEYREVDMRKITVFIPHTEIKTRLKKLFTEMNSKSVNINNKFEIAQYVADYYYGLIEIHPFREGNGRTSREFIRQLVLARFSEYELDYTKINKENFQIGVINHERYPLLLAYEIYNALVEKENIKGFGNK